MPEKNKPELGERHPKTIIVVDDFHGDRTDANLICKIIDDTLDHILDCKNKKEPDVTRATVEQPTKQAK